VRTQQGAAYQQRAGPQKRAAVVDHLKRFRTVGRLAELKHGLRFGVKRVFKAKTEPANGKEPRITRMVRMEDGAVRNFFL
jgi:hypothetical protein